LRPAETRAFNLNRLRKKFRPELRGKRVITLHIPDDYEYMDEELMDRITTGVAPHVQFSPHSD
jgi:predicted protein tyrosine phosphatase